jgi:SNF2 family DNA or RNA helicase
MYLKIFYINIKNNNMNIEGNTYLFYDKYCDDHKFSNPKTINITLEDLYGGDYVCITGIEAIKEFNKYGATNILNLDLDLDLDFYQLSFFKIPKTKIDNEKKILIVCINHDKLKKNLNNIPNKDFLITACSYHCAYIGIYNSNKIKKNINELIKVKSIESNSDPTDPIIKEPTFSKLKLFEYQKRTVKWIVNTELEKRELNYSFNDEVFFGDIVYDSVKKIFISTEDRKKIIWYGGLLADEVGLGKTWEMICASLMNPSKNISYYKDPEYLCSKATLIVCQNHLAKQWIREFEKTIKEEYNLNVIQLFTKPHHDKVTYLDLLDADFIVISYEFLRNEAYYDNWIKNLSQNKKGVTYVNSDLFLEEKVTEKLMEIINSIKKNPTKLFDVKPVLNCIKYHRVIFDEFHTLVTDTKNTFILKLLKFFKSTFRWIVTGTPFDKSDDCLEKMVDYVTNHSVDKLDKILNIDVIQNYLLNKFYRKNTNKSRESEYKLKPIKEEVIKLKFTPTERALYNAYIVNSNIDKLSVAARQLCNDPRLLDELKDELSGCKTPEDIQKTLVSHHKKNMDIASKKVRFMNYKIKKTERKIKITEFKRYRKFLKQLGYRVQIEYPEKIVDPEFDNKNNGELDMDDIVDNNDNNDNNDDTDSENEEELNNKPLMIVNDENTNKILKLVNKLLNNNPSITLNNIKINLDNLNNKLKECIKQYEGKRSTSEFFTNMMEKINKITEKQKQKKLNDNDIDDNDIDDNTDEDETCSICLGEITGEDVGVTKCGHMYCYLCIKEMIQSNPKCPLCMKPTKLDEIYMISFEDLSRKEQTKEIKDKISLINKVGTKLANLIFYIKNSKDKCIVFSQWDDLLKKVGDTLDIYGVQNVFCRGNVWTRDKTIRDFTTKQDVKVIMLSSASAAAGTNLTIAKKVILLEPVSGTYEFRKNTEKQAIGRAHRTGQLDEVTVVRFIIKDTVEEEIYNENIIEDAKFKSDIEIKMLSDDNLNLTKEEIELIAKDVEINEKKKELKPKKKLTTKSVKHNNKTQ